jgi:hypothetical protein
MPSFVSTTEARSAISGVTSTRSHLIASNLQSGLSSRRRPRRITAVLINYGYINERK